MGMQLSSGPHGPAYLANRWRAKAAAIMGVSLRFCTISGSCGWAEKCAQEAVATAADLAEGARRFFRTAGKVGNAFDCRARVRDAATPAQPAMESATTTLAVKEGRRRLSTFRSLKVAVATGIFCGQIMARR